MAVELRKLRERVKRDVIAERLQAPELRQPPLAELPVNVAAAKLADAAAEKADWKRAYDLVLVAESGERAPRFAVAPSARSQAIHSYLTALNLEKAEQYREAIAAYQLVLQNVTDRVPTQEATDHLKALRKTHPEAFSAPAVGSVDERVSRGQQHRSLPAARAGASSPRP